MGSKWLDINGLRYLVGLIKGSMEDLRSSVQSSIDDAKTVVDGVTIKRDESGKLYVVMDQSGSVVSYDRHVADIVNADDESTSKAGNVISVKDLGITSEKIAAGAVTSEKLADDSVGAGKLADEAVTSAKLANGSVVAEKLADASVTADKIAASAIASKNIANGAVEGEKLASESVTTEKIADSSVTSEKLADGSITPDKVSVDFSEAVQKPKIGKDIAAYSWDELITLARDPETAGQLDYLIGQTRGIYLAGYGNFDFQLVGINHDNLADGSGKAAMTFMAVDCVLQRQMNSSNTNSGGWNSTAMRTFLNGTLYNAFPAYLREYMKECKIEYCPSTSAYTSPSTCKDKVWLASAKEVFGNTTYGDEGDMYAYWSQNNNNQARIKNYNGSAVIWWLRSVYSTTYFASVYSGGILSDYGYANGTCGVVPCFAIG